MRRPFAALQIALIGLVAPVCLESCAVPRSRGDAEVEVRLLTDPSPVMVGEVDVTVEVVDPGWKPVNGAQVYVTLAPEDGGRSPETLAGRALGAGRYSVGGVSLPTAGMWAVTIRVELTGGLWMEVDQSLDVGEGTGVE